MYEKHERKLFFSILCKFHVQARSSDLHYLIFVCFVVHFDDSSSPLKNS